LFRYDRRFSTDLREITHRSLEQWNEEKPTRSVTTLLANWPLLERIHDDNAIFDPRIQNPVHGDANRANVLVPASGAAGTVKLVDWEWAGWRTPQFDLASLTKGRSEALKEQGIEAFGASDTSLSLGDHRALTSWALIDLRLLDASYVVAQHYGAPGASRMDLDRYLHISVSEILSTLDQLDSAS
jgi:aminoglycoside phosphotransferase (APT) family kinase protein